MAKKHIDVIKYHGKTVEELQVLHTGTLMNIRTASYYTYGCECCSPKHTSVTEAAFNVAQSQLRAKVCEILKTREHVPNKVEAKAARQASAKQGK